MNVRKKVVLGEALYYANYAIEKLMEAKTALEALKKKLAELEEVDEDGN